MALFVKVSTRFFTHRKTAMLRARLGDAAYWLPPRLWCYAAEQQPDGDLSQYTAEALAAVLGYNGDATSMLNALQETGFIDPDKRIHGWQEHNGYHKTFSERGRKAAQARWNPEPENSSPHPSSTTTEKEIEIERETSIASSMQQACMKHSKGKKGAKASPPAPDLDSLLNDLQNEPAYEGLDVRKVHAKMTVWCKANGKHPTYKRLVNWLNTEKPLPSNPQKLSKADHSKNPEIF